MSDELLAMLEAKSPKFTPGRGGVPELTALDVAGALGMGADKFAMLAFQLTRGGSLHAFEQFDEMLACRQFGEWRERAERLIEAQLAIAAAKYLLAKIAGKAKHAQMMMEGARAGMWPALNDFEGKYQAIRRAVVAELRMPRICPICQGTKEITLKAPESKIVACNECRGLGFLPVFDRSRAQAIKIDVSNYNRTWRKVYEWTYQLVADAAVTGREQFSESLK